MKLIHQLKAILFVTAGLLFFSSCDKPEKYEPIGDGGQKLFKIVDYGGLSNFSNTALVYDPASTSEVLEFHVEYHGPTVLSNDMTVTIGVNEAAITAYNAGVAPADQYSLLPATTYTLLTGTAKIKAGQTISEAFSIEFNPSLIDQSKNLMLPITITSSAGAPADVKVVSSGIAYFHFIGNPLAGPYTVTGTRYNYTGSVSWAGPPAAIPAGYTGTVNLNRNDAAIPLSSSTVNIALGNVPMPGASSQAYYYISGSSGFSILDYNFASAFNAGYSNIKRYIVSYTAPSPTQKPSFHLITQYNNTTGGAGNDRIVDETFVHQ